MLITLKNNLHWIIFTIGLIFYFVLLSNIMLSWSIAWLLFIIYSWLIISIIFQRYVFKHLLYLLCFSGIWVSLTWLFIKGVEEVPLPRGAFIFKVEGIIPSIILFMLFTIPLIIYHFGTQIKLEQSNKRTMLQKEEDNLGVTLKDDNWEEASIEDLEGGKFEII